LDQVDRTIVLELSNNCRISYMVLAGKLKITQQAIGKRVRGLLESGFISDFALKANLGLIGGEQFIAIVDTHGFEDEEEYANVLGQYELVSDVGIAASSQYIVLGCYTQMTEINEFRRYLVELKETAQVKIHILISPRRTTGDFSRKQKAILASLIDCPRKSVREISKLTGISEKNVGKSLKRIFETGSICFTIQWNPSAGLNISFILRLTWDEKYTYFEEIAKEIEIALSDNLFWVKVSATDPSIYALVVCNNIGQVAKIDKILKAVPYVSNVRSIICKKWQPFSDIACSQLRDMLSL